MSDETKDAPKPTPPAKKAEDTPEGAIKREAPAQEPEVRKTGVNAEKRGFKVSAPASVVPPAKKE